MVFMKLEHCHISIIKKWAEHDSIKTWIAIDDWDAYYEYASNDVNTNLFAIYDDEHFIGGLSAENDNAADCLNISLIINPNFHNRGLGTNALNYFAKNVQSLIGILPRYIHAGIYAGNIASIKCFSKAGYVSHGVDIDGEERYLLYL